MRDATRREVSLAALFRAPTPRLFAALLDAAPSLDKPVAMPTVAATPAQPPALRKTPPTPERVFAVEDGIFPIQTRGSGPTIVAFNNPGMFHPLSRRLGPGRPFVALRPLDPTRHPREHPQDFSEIASVYADALRRAVPDGPVILLGLCVAGTLAHEVAARLRAERRAVPLLVIVDSWAPGYMRQGGTRQRFLTRGAYAWGAARSAAARRGDGQLTLRRSLAERPAVLAARHGMDHLAVRLGLREALSPEVEERRFAEWLYRASEAHVPLRYAGRTLLLHRDDMPRGGRWLDPALGWGKFLIGPTEQHGLPGDHTGIFREPGATRMAQHIEDMLAAPVGDVMDLVDGRTRLAG